MLPLFIELGLIGFIVLLYWLIVVRVINRERASRRSPFTKELRRSPGEGCRRKMEEFYDKSMESHSILAIGFGMVIGIAIGTINPIMKSPLTIILFLTIGTIAVVYLLLQIRHSLREAANYRLGFDGERQTAQALLPLLGDGYELFHDLEFKTSTGETFNIDHVLFGPVGVIAIETKSKSKDSAAKGAESVRVRYDGKRISFPSGYETVWLDQAIASAKHLSRELSAYTGIKTWVRAAISIPGWLVEQTTRDVDPVVHNPEMLRRWVQGLPLLDSSREQQNRIRSFLERESAKSP